MKLSGLILSALLAALAGLCVLPKAADLPRPRRGQQFWMPAASLLYGLAALLTMDGLASLVVEVFVLLARRFPFLELFPLTAGLSLICAILLLLAYIPFKFVILRVFSRPLSRIRPLYDEFTGRFYEKSEDYEGEFLQECWCQVRDLFRWLFAGSVLTTTVMLGISFAVTFLSAYRYPFYPVLAVIVLGEIVSFLSGMTLPEYEEKILGMGENARRKGSLARLRRIYRDLFPGHLLCDQSVERSGEGESASHLIKQLAESDLPEEQALGGYFDRLFSAGVPLDEGRMISSRDLLSGRSVLYADPFYKDLTPYLTFVFCRTLVRGGRLLILTGRPETAPEAEEWLRDTLSEASGAPTLWKVGPLSDDGDLDAAVLSAAGLYDRELFTRCSAFLSKVRFVLLIEPSRTMTAGQIGLKLLLSYCGGEDPVTYAACDRNQDGLVDALSHLLETSLTEVISTDAPASGVTAMFWKADGSGLHHKVFGGVARCLGTGTELAAVALKNQVEEVHWFGSTRAPLLDIRWLLGQYSRPVCEYAGVQPSQHWLDRSVRFHTDLWGQRRQKRIFAIAEDEFDNLFETARQYATRADDQAFLHILSGRYLLRDYMCANADMLGADPKAIPAIAADYAATSRNTAVRILMLLAEEPVRESRLLRELGEEGGEGPVLDRLIRLLSRYFPLDKYPNSVQYEERDEISGDGIPYYYIADSDFLREVAAFLRPAHWISEREGEEPLDSRLLCHVWQTCLPGQFCTLAGKYYEILSVSRERGVLVRRAADHFTGRKYYRQLRDYTLSSFEEQSGTGDLRSVSGISIRRLTADVSVSTCGYLSLDRYDDLKNGRKVLVDGIPERQYRRRELIAIRFPGVSDDVRLTIAVMLRELFVTAFPDSHHYLAVVTDLSAFPDLPDGLAYGLQGGEAETVYLVEDSPVDLGLTVAAERHLIRFLEQMTDYLSWHEQQMQPPPAPDPNAVSAAPPPAFTYPNTKKQGIFRRFAGWIKKTWSRFTGWLKNLFKKKGAQPVPPSAPAPQGGQPVPPTAVPAPQPAAPASSAGTAVPAVSPDPASQSGGLVQQPFDDTGGKSNKRMLLAANTADPDSLTGVSSDPQAVSGGYAASHYLLFGFGRMPDGIAPADTLQYLTGFGFDRSLLHETREGGTADTDDFDANGHCCDFCGAPLSGAEYDVLSDGRERCVTCRRTAVDTVKEFQDIYQATRRNMEDLFGIHIKAGIRVRVTNAKEIAERQGKTFHPAAAMTSRAVGIAVSDSTGFTLLVENGAPRVDIISTVVHELTHIWQYQNWNERELKKIWAHLPPKDAAHVRLEVYEGMAVWAEIQYLYLIHESARARRTERAREADQSEYGRGLLRYRDRYPFAPDGVLGATPFQAGSAPLPPVDPGNI